MKERKEEKTNNLINETLVANIARDLDKIGELIFNMKNKKLSEGQINVINRSIATVNQQHHLFIVYKDHNRLVI